MCKCQYRHFVWDKKVLLQYFSTESCWKLFSGIASSNSSSFLMLLGFPECVHHSITQCNHVNLLIIYFNNLHMNWSVGTKLFLTLYEFQRHFVCLGMQLIISQCQCLL